jgi:hypothetical protein
MAGQLQREIIITPPQMDRQRKIIKLLLSEQAIPILEKKLNRKPS